MKELTKSQLEAQAAFMEFAKNVGEFETSILTDSNLCTLGVCEHSQGSDKNRCIEQSFYTYLGPVPLSKRAWVQGVEYEGRLPIAKQPLAMKAYLYTDNTVGLNFYYVGDYDKEEDYLEDINKFIITSTEESNIIKSIELDLYDFIEESPRSVVNSAVESIKLKKVDAFSYHEYLNCLAVEKLLTEADSNCLYEVIEYCGGI